LLVYLRHPGQADAEVAGERRPTLELAEVEQGLVISGQLERIAAFLRDWFWFGCGVCKGIPGKDGGDVGVVLLRHDGLPRLARLRWAGGLRPHPGDGPVRLARRARCHLHRLGLLTSRDCRISFAPPGASAGDRGETAGAT
jgi:hypothetical protein